MIKVKTNKTGGLDVNLTGDLEECCEEVADLVSGIARIHNDLPEAIVKGLAAILPKRKLLKIIDKIYQNEQDPCDLIIHDFTED